jgi:hypothetical protein
MNQKQRQSDAYGPIDHMEKPWYFHPRPSDEDHVYAKSLLEHAMHLSWGTNDGIKLWKWKLNCKLQVHHSLEFHFWLFLFFVAVASQEKVANCPNFHMFKGKGYGRSSSGSKVLATSGTLPSWASAVCRLPKNCCDWQMGIHPQNLSVVWLAWFSTINLDIVKWK